MRQTKDVRMNSDFNTSASVLPSRAGDGDTLIPADFHRGDLGFGIALAAGNDRAGMAHAAARAARCGRR